MNTRSIIISLMFSCLFCSSALTQNKSDTDFSKLEEEIISKLSSLKNPFLPPPLPPPPPKPVEPPKPVVVTPPPEPPKPAPKPVEKKTEPVDIASLNFKLSGMVWGENPQAIINGYVVGIGEKVGDAQVLSITQKGVEILYKQIRINLTVDQGIKKVSTKKKVKKKAQPKGRKP